MEKTSQVSKKLKSQLRMGIFRNKETGDYDEYGPYQPQFTNKEHKVKSKQKQRRDRRKKRKNAKQSKNSSKNKPAGDLNEIHLLLEGEINVEFRCWRPFLLVTDLRFWCIDS